MKRIMAQIPADMVGEGTIITRIAFCADTVRDYAGSLISALVVLCSHHLHGTRNTVATLLIFVLLGCQMTSAAAIPRQESFGNTNIPSVTPLPTSVQMSTVTAWPTGFVKGTSAFAGSSYDGKSLWLVPFAADRVVALDTTTGVMTGYKTWPSGFVKGDYAFYGSSYEALA